MIEESEIEEKNEPEDSAEKNVDKEVATAEDVEPKDGVDVEPKDGEDVKPKDAEVVKPITENNRRSTYLRISNLDTMMCSLMKKQLTKILPKYKHVSNV
jgi:hypothetical protein